MSAAIRNHSFVMVFVVYLMINLGLEFGETLVSPLSASLGATPVVIGMVATGFTYGSMIFRLAAGSAIDAFDRRKLLFIAVAILAVAFLGDAFATSVPVLMCFRILQGVGQAFTAPICLTLAAGTVTRENFAGGIGTLSVARGVAGMCGPYVALRIQETAGYQVAFLLAMGIEIVTLIAILNLRVEHNRTEKFRFSLSGFLAREAIPPALMQFLFMMAWSCVFAFGAADVFLETERKDFRMFSLEERERAVELYFTTPMTTAQVVEHLGYPTRQCLERWLAMDSRYAGHMAKPIIPLETRRRAVELVLGGMQQKQAAKQLGVSVGAVHGWVRAYRKGGMAALQPKNRNSAQGNKPADSRRWPSAADDDDAEALRRRVEELELENALMREVVEVVKKDPGADLRRLSNREKTLLIDRLRPAYSLSSMTCLLAIAPSSYHYHHARLGVDKYAGLRAEVAGAFADSKGRYGYRRIKAVLKTGVSEKVVRRIMAEEGLVAHVPKRRRYSSYEGETTPAPANLVDRDFTAERPNEKWLTDISEIKARDGKVYLSPMIDCFDGKIVAYTAGFSPNAELANRMLEKAASTLPGNARPLVHSDRGCHYRWPGWLGLMERFGLTRSMSAKGCSPDNAAAEGFFGRMKTEAVYPEKWEEHTRNEVLALVDEYIRWYNHERIKQSLGWMSPVQYRQSQGMAA
ncbi:IS3 family transposase [Bifidobacterium miconisargentati]|nr:IS3 family transposase [Bifidobacterium miconisargentati]MBW3090024.1 IS3 family transposase [Bifidobacterium miconisargentati]